MSARAKAWRVLLAPPGMIGRAGVRAAGAGVTLLCHLGGIAHLLARTLAFVVAAPPRRRRGLRAQLFVMMSNVGVQSFPIVALISFLMGAILLLQSGEPLERFGQLREVPGAVAWSLTREISPLLTAIILTARVGASFTAVLASMRINEEVLALETMAIHPIGYLVVPRFLSMLVMVPCLTVTAFLIGMTGSAVIASSVYGLPYAVYVERTVYYLSMTDIWTGLVKATVFSVIISVVGCYYGLIADGGSVGLGRYIMVSVVTSLVAVILADAILTAWINNYIL